MSRSLARNDCWAGNHALEQAARQLGGAGGIAIEWRVAGQTAATQLQRLFQFNNVPIRVVSFLKQRGGLSGPTPRGWTANPAAKTR
jgi:hypothetical protein